MAHTWTSDEDFEKDLVLYAEYCIPKPNKTPVPVPDSILKFRAQMAKNRESNLNDGINHNAMYVISGRGKGVKDRIILPGGNFETLPQDDFELSQQIRQTVGMGYSNQLIESSFATENFVEANETFLDVDDGFRFVSSPSSTSSSQKNCNSSQGDASNESESSEVTISKSKTTRRFKKMSSASA